jgi:hypothetical protein
MDSGNGAGSAPMEMKMNKIETFKLALGKTNLMGGDATREAYIDAGDDIFGGLVYTHETLADHEAARGRRADQTVEADGLTMYVWNRVQVRKGGERVTVYFMPFPDVALAMTS